MLRRLFKPHSILSAIFYLWKFQFYRRWWGGHWELWWVEITCSEIWHDVEKCSLKTGKRPHSFLHGTPVCEDYTYDRRALSRECAGFNCYECLSRALDNEFCQCDCHDEDENYITNRKKV